MLWRPQHSRLLSFLALSSTVLFSPFFPVLEMKGWPQERRLHCYRGRAGLPWSALRHRQTPWVSEETPGLADSIGMPLSRPRRRPGRAHYQCSRALTVGFCRDMSWQPWGGVDAPFPRERSRSSEENTCHDLPCWGRAGCLGVTVFLHARHLELLLKSLSRRGLALGGYFGQAEADPGLLFLHHVLPSVTSQPFDVGVSSVTEHRVPLVDMYKGGSVTP